MSRHEEDPRQVSPEVEVQSTRRQLFWGIVSLVGIGAFLDGILISCDYSRIHQAAPIDPLLLAVTGIAIAIGANSRIKLR